MNLPVQTSSPKLRPPAGQLEKLEFRRMFSWVRWTRTNLLSDIQAGSGGHRSARTGPICCCDCICVGVISRWLRKPKCRTSRREVARHFKTRDRLYQSGVRLWLLRTRNRRARLYARSPYESGNRPGTPSFSAVFVSPEIVTFIGIDINRRPARRYLSLQGRRWSAR